MLLAKDDKLSASYYEASVKRPEALPSLTGSARADVCVIGGGLAIGPQRRASHRRLCVRRCDRIAIAG
jgi:hypothetical protein